MSQLNPNLVLVAVVIVVLAVSGLMAVVFFLGGPNEQIIARAGLVTAFAVPIVVSLIALVQTVRVQATIAAMDRRVSDLERR